MFKRRRLEKSAFSAGFGSLCNDVLKCIFLFLYANDVLKVLRVNRWWKQVACSPSLWVHFKLEFVMKDIRSIMDEEEISATTRRRKERERNKKEGKGGKEGKTTAIDPYLPHVRWIFSQFSPFLRHLSLVRSGQFYNYLKPRDIDIIRRHCPQLKTFESNEVFNVLDLAPSIAKMDQLTHLYLHDAYIVNFRPLFEMPHLKEFGFCIDNGAHDVDLETLKNAMVRKKIRLKLLKTSHWLLEGPLFDFVLSLPCELLCPFSHCQNVPLEKLDVLWPYTRFVRLSFENQSCVTPEWIGSFFQSRDISSLKYLTLGATATHANLHYIQQSCPNLLLLDFEDSYAVLSEVCLKTVLSMSALLYLRMDNCKFLNDENMLYLLQNKEFKGIRWPDVNFMTHPFRNAGLIGFALIAPNIYSTKWDHPNAQKWTVAYLQTYLETFTQQERIQFQTGDFDLELVARLYIMCEQVHSLVDVKSHEHTSYGYVSDAEEDECSVNSAGRMTFKYRKRAQRTSLILQPI